MPIGREKPGEERSSPWAVHLFGKFMARAGNTLLERLPGRRTKELLGYLLLFRERPHHREVLAGTLWPESSTPQSRKYLRQGLWHLGAPDRADGKLAPLLTADAEWVQANRTSLWLDVAELEEAFAPVKLVPGERLDAEQATSLKKVVPLYAGDVLEGCYQDWCVYERERLKALYISLLEKLLGYCETRGELEEGLIYGEKLLQNDRAHERAHWRLMRLRYLAGDRTGALRQFERCREALSEELGVAPGERIGALYDKIRVDGGLDAPTGPLTSAAVPEDMAPANFWHPSGPGRADAVAGRELDLATAPLHQALRALRLAGKLVEQSLQAAQQHDQ